MFITFEGPDGSGKSTQARLLAAHLRAQGREVVEVREPGGTALGEAVRAVLLESDIPIEPVSASLLLSAARAQLVREVIVPALTRGAVVVADRFADSTTAYQGAGQGVDRDTIEHLRAIAAPVQPDVTVLVDVPPAVGLSRVDARGAPNRLDREAAAFHTRVREAYLALVAEEPRRWVYVDGTGSPEAVHRATVTAVEDALQEMLA